MSKTAPLINPYPAENCLSSKSITKPKIRPLEQHQDFLGPFLDLSGTFSHYFLENAKNMRKWQKKTRCRDISHFKIYVSNGQQV